MQPKKKILVAVDGSDQSLRVVSYVGRLLPPEQTVITLLHVLSRMPESFWDLDAEPRKRYALPELGSWKNQEREFMEDFMVRAVEILRDAGFVKRQVNAVVRERKAGVARDIAAEAQKGYQALAVGRRGTGSLKNLVLGSTASKLVNHVSRVPVWVVGGRPDPGKFLVAMDSSESAVRILEYVGSYLNILHKELLLFHAIRGIDIAPVRQGQADLSQKLKDWLARVKHEVIESEKEIMQSLLERRILNLKGSGMDVSRISTKIVTGVSSRAGCVVEEAKKGGYGTIVIGRKGISKVDEFLMGRVTVKVLQMAKDKAVWTV